MALYYDEMKNLDPKDPKKADRDRLVLSKGHACPTLYAILADLGYFPKEDLAHLRQIDSHLQGHPDCNKTPGVDMNTGSLGQGMSLATGLALAAKHAKADYKVYAVVGDGECQEGIVWEQLITNLITFAFYLTITDFRSMELTIRSWDLETSLRSLKPSVSNALK